MSRSFRKTPIFGNAGGSDKQSKRWANRAYRNAEKRMIKLTADTEECPWGVDADYTMVPHRNEIHNPHSFKKDGKHYWTEASDRDMMK